MKKRIIEKNNIRIVIINENKPILNDSQSVLDIISTIGYFDECNHIVFNKSAIHNSFFDLSSGLAGELLQKFINYNYKIAIIGDFTEYKSKALKDFIYECNKGNHIFFVDIEEEAIIKLAME